MGEAAPGRGGLLRLAGELAGEWALAERVADQVRADARRLAALIDAPPADPDLARGASAALALGLHRWYSALEAMLERVERTFGTLPTGPEWHTELLQGAAVEIPEVRPPLLPPDALPALRELLKFRHFLRHAYAVELDGARLRVLAESLAATRAPVGEAVRAFGATLRAMARALEG